MFNHIEELPDVTGPGGGGQCFKRVGREAADGFAVLPGDQLDKMRGKQWDVLASLIQTRQVQRHDIQAIVEILAKLRLSHCRIKIAMVCRKQSHINRLRLARALMQSPVRLVLLDEPFRGLAIDPAQYVGIHARVSEFVARGRQFPVKVNFSSARSAPSLYPGEALKNAATRALRKYPDLLVRPAPPNGNAEFRNVLARRAMVSGMVLAPEELVVTQGCIEALNLALRAVTQPGDIVAVESPTFYGLLQVLEALGLRALEIPTSPQTGISLEALELAAQTHERITAIVVVPTLQNPLGSIMPDAHKARLVDFCARSEIALIEDDTYSALVNDDAPVRALKSWDRNGNVIHCASLHKILAPGMRLGWMNAGRWHSRVEMLKYVQSRNNEELAQLVAAEFMGSSAYDRHLRQLRSNWNSTSSADDSSL